jgi:RNA polymerase sigma factor (sigma-70 family)
MVPQAVGDRLDSGIASGAERSSVRELLVAQVSQEPWRPGKNSKPSSPIGSAELGSLYDAYGVECLRVALGVVRDRHLAGDVVQEVFAAIWRGDAAFDPARGSLRSWILTITHHKAVDAVRKSERRTGRSTTDERLTHTPGADDVEEAGWQRLRRDHILAALASLTVVQRQTIMLAYFDGYSQSEIAELTGTALGTVKTRTLHALRRLRLNIDLAAVAIDEGWHRGA